ncbi:MAG: TSUP family transporter [Legionellaceae bacterium]|nr:TSUP family transporter [Legionellaceae bacterium]
MTIKILMSCIVFLTLICMLGMLYKYKKNPSEELSLNEKIRLFGCGVLAFISDTLGVGSFIVNTALAKLLKTFKDEELPGANNGAQVLPGAISAFFFIKVVEVDLTTLIVLITGTCIGGIIGGGIMSRLNKQSVRLTMVGCFSIIAVLLISRKLNILPVGGDAIALHSWKLIAGFVGMIACGALSSAGAGLFALVQGVLFVLEMSPIVAFPIMMAAGAMQQPLTTMMFLKQDKIPLKKTLILTLGGCIGVLIVLPIFNYITVSWLHSLLLTILIYNIYAIGKAYLSSKSEKLTPLEQKAA